MDISKHIKFLQMAYAGVLADSVLQFSRENVLNSVTQRKHQEQITSGQLRASQFGITKPEEVFTRLSEIFHCTQWNITGIPEGGFTAQADSCMLCSIARKIGAPSPCHLYCLDPMEGLVKAIKNDAVYMVKETLWDSNQCLVHVL